MDQPRPRRVGRRARLDPRHELLALRHVVGPGLLEALAPALDLALDVALRVAEVGEADGLVIERVQLDQRVDEVQAQPARALGRVAEPLRQVAAQDDALDLLHHVERRAEQGGVLGVREHARAGEVRRERLHDAKLAVHVVAGLRLGAARRPAQDHPARAHAQLVGQVRRSALELAQLERPVGQAGNLRLQERQDLRGIERIFVAHRAGFVEQHLAHVFPFQRNVSRLASFASSRCATLLKPSSVRPRRPSRNTCTEAL